MNINGIISFVKLFTILSQVRGEEPCKRHRLKTAVRVCHLQFASFYFEAPRIYSCNFVSNGIYFHYYKVLCKFGISAQYTSTQLGVVMTPLPPSF